MISDSAGHVAKNQSGLPPGRKGQCIPAQRAFLSSSSIFPFLLDSECVTLRSDLRRIPECQRSPLSPLTAQLADRSCLSWIRVGGLPSSATVSSSSYFSPAPSENTLATPNSREGEMKGEERTHTHTKICRYNSCSNKRIQERGEKREEKKKKPSKVCVGGGVGGGEQGQKKESPSLFLAFKLKLFKDLVSFIFSD